MEYYSDASMSGSDSDSEEEEIVPLYTRRELDYWELEALLDSRGPPLVIAYAAKIGVVQLRDCVMSLPTSTIERVVDAKTAHSWKDFWQGKDCEKTSLFSTKDWHDIGEFCLQLCVCCIPNPSPMRVRSCMIDILKYGKFK